MNMPAKGFRIEEWFLDVAVLGTFGKSRFNMDETSCSYGNAKTHSKVSVNWATDVQSLTGNSPEIRVWIIPQFMWNLHIITCVTHFSLLDFTQVLHLFLLAHLNFFPRALQLLPCLNFTPLINFHVPFFCFFFAHIISFPHVIFLYMVCSFSHVVLCSTYSTIHITLHTFTCSNAISGHACRNELAPCFLVITYLPKRYVKTHDNMKCDFFSP